MKNQITVFLRGKQTMTYDLDQFHKDKILMGRGPVHGSGGAANDIRIGDDAEFISRSQCFFKRDPQGNWYIVDDNSTNGMYFQNNRVKYWFLRDGDRILIGSEKDVNRSLMILFTVHSTQFSGSIVQGTSLEKYDRFVIGRSPDCSLVLNHPTVSRQHCIITQEKGQFYISDNHSTNGIILNSMSLERKTLLRDMDRISIADFSFVFNNGVLYSYQLTGGVSITVSHLKKAVGNKKNRKFITNDVSLSIDPNNFVAIIGGSGAGKTTLLKCIAGLSDFTSGEVLINGDSIRTGSKSLQSLMGYVPQQDIVYESLTLEKMLTYSARLRMPKDTSPKEIRQKINETLEIVELKEHRKTMISKLSGGQKKRASIAVELLASPKLFFLDEPSSGLDPGTEKHLMQMLKRLSEAGRTIVMVTHNVQNIDLCDKVICMGKGGVLCFSGTPSDARQFFGTESMTDAYDALNDNAVETAERFNAICGDNVREAAAGAEKSQKKGKSRTRKGAGKSFVQKMSWLFQDFLIMTKRYIEIMVNNPARLGMLLVLPIILSFLVCIAFEADGGFYNLLLKMNLSFDRNSFPFYVALDTQKIMFSFSCAVFWTGIFNSIQEISKERPIYERESFSGVSSLPYVISKFVPLTVLCFIQSVIMTVVLLFMTSTVATVDGNTASVTALAFGMPSDGAVLTGGLMWLETLLTTFLCALSAMCIGLLISSLVSNEIALVICPVCLMPQILFSGVVADLSGITDIISYFVSCRWSCLAYCISAGINDLMYSCKYKSGVWDSVTLADGSDSGIFNAEYDLVHDFRLGLSNIGFSWFMLFLMSVGCIIAAVLILRYSKRYKN